MNNQAMNNYGMTELNNSELAEINGGGLWLIAAGAAAVGATVIGLYIIGKITKK